MQAIGAHHMFTLLQMVQHRLGRVSTQPQLQPRDNVGNLSCLNNDNAPSSASPDFSKQSTHGKCQREIDQTTREGDKV